MAATQLSIAVLVDNKAINDDFETELGLSLWLERGDTHVLFDTGQGDRFAHNALALGIHLGATDALVLSHGHYDHGGGLREVTERAPNARWFMHPGCITSRLSRRDPPPPREVGLSRVALGVIRRHARDITWTLGPTQINDDMWLTGPVPRRSEHEPTSDTFFLDDACEIPDPIVDDQALCVDTKRGLVVVTGCAHAGIINILDYVTLLAPTEHIHAVVGGLHLMDASISRLEQTAMSFKRYGVDVIAPCHCTSDDAIALLRQRLDERVVDCVGGTVLTF